MVSKISQGILERAFFSVAEFEGPALVSERQ